jgi:chromate reductase
MSTYTVGYFVGSLSSTSINRELSKVLIRLAPGELKFHEIAIGDLPPYSPDYDANYPHEAITLKEAIGRCDACCSSRPSTTGRYPGR